jgi:hypothetical protein
MFSRSSGSTISFSLYIESLALSLISSTFSN